MKTINAKEPIPKSPLLVYKASAGSGKTFRLAVDYIKLLIQNPYAANSILAVTFTNKATGEMKSRIISKLYSIGLGLPDSKQYFKCVKDELGYSEKVIRFNARKALYLLLLNYNTFHVETIDSFFQSVLRNLAREMDLIPNLRVELNDSQVEANAVDDLIVSLKKNSNEMTSVITLIEQSMDEDKNWNIIDKLQEFGENIFNDTYKQNSKALSNLHYQHIYIVLAAERSGAEKEIKNVCQEFWDYYDKNGLSEEDFIGKSNSRTLSYFVKLGKDYYKTNENFKSLNTKTINTAIEKGAWLKSNPKGDLFLQQLAERAEKAMRRYRSARLTQTHLYQIALLDTIEKMVRNRNQETNSFLLSDTQTLLQGLIADSDSPFIYEKIGARLQHIMIDEFQDTSTIQWRNFKVLLNDIVARTDKDVGGGSLIVGDVKQSIYRWRSGDWELLNNIDKEFAPSQIHIEPMKENYRSLRNVVNFNDAFFEKVQDIVADKLDNECGEGYADQMRSAYADVHQYPMNSSKEQGVVDIQFLETSGSKEEKKEEILKRTADTVANLINNYHVKPKQIALIVRDNNTIKDTAAYFMQNGVANIISDEAFLLEASHAVNIIIAALRIIQSPEDLYALAQLAMLVNGNDQLSFNKMACKQADTKDNKEAKEAYLSHYRSLIPDKFIGELSSLKTKPLKDLVEEIINIFGLTKEKGQEPYLNALSDELTAFMQNTLGDIYDFLNLWDETLHKKSIPVKNDNGVRMITIHKSKGLEFDYVIMPFADWRLEKPGNTLWTKPSEPPYSQIPLVPVDFSQGLLKTVYEGDYKEEHFQNMIDNMNLLYVAFTRAKKGLFVIANEPAKSGGSAINAWIKSTVSAFDKNELNGFSWTENNHFSFGSLEPEPEQKDSDKDSQSDNVFERTPEDVSLSFDYPQKNHVKFKQSNDSKEFLNDEEENDEQQQCQYLQLGNLLHHVFANIRTMDDIEPQLNQMQYEGLLEDVGLTRDRLAAIIHRSMQKEVVKDWFSPRWTLHNECNISFLSDKQKIEVRRPDRVMKDAGGIVVVDYKFGEPQSGHKDQLRHYMNLLTEMGEHVKAGYIWYVLLEKIEKVELNNKNI